MQLRLWTLHQTQRVFLVLELHHPPHLQMLLVLHGAQKNHNKLANEKHEWEKNCLVCPENLKNVVVCHICEKNSHSPGSSSSVGKFIYYDIHNLQAVCVKTIEQRFRCHLLSWRGKTFSGGRHPLKSSDNLRCPRSSGQWS